jgi:uncharacterized protein
MQLEWDEVKRLSNLTKHGLDFADVAEVLRSEVVEFEDLREDYGELRFRAYGLLKGIVVQIVYTPRDETLRLISFRKATDYETEQYIKSTS